MKIDTAWVAKPNVIGGLDHVGTQGPCIAIYSQLLPGITNVTDRARYYSFYPWFIWSFDQRHPDADFDRFVALYRRADCLFTLIAERHARVAGDSPEVHGPAMVGRQQLTPAVGLLERNQQIRLSSFATRDEVTSRYFANRLGGLGQYYAGTLYQLDILHGKSKPWIGYTKDRGQALAEAFEASVPSDLFWSTLEDDTVTAERLDDLSAFCPCCLRSDGRERKSLLDILFDPKNSYAEAGVQRRKSLALILDLAKSLREADSWDLEVGAFRAAVYTQTLPGGSPWRPPAALANTLNGWKYYVRNDILSVAIQAVFSVGLLGLHDAQSAPDSIEAFARSLASDSKLRGELRGLGGSFADLCDRVRAEVPPLEHMDEPRHELKWVRARLDPQSEEELTESSSLVTILRVLALLHVRDDLDQPAYGTLAIDAGVLNDSPINLISFRARCVAWQGMGLEAVAADLLAWCLDTHLRVALRKLRSTGAATFRFRPSETGIEPMGEIPQPAQTNPRFRQAAKILQDVGALNRAKGDAAPLKLTALGITLHAQAQAHV